MNGEFSLWRVSVLPSDVEKFITRLPGTADDGHFRIQESPPAPFWNRFAIFHIVLTEEELIFLKLSTHDLRAEWLQDWIYAKL